MKENSGSTQLVWADITPELALLMLVRENEIRNERVASIRRVDGRRWKLVCEKHNGYFETMTVEGTFAKKIDAMERAIASYVAKRLDKANGEM